MTRVPYLELRNGPLPGTRVTACFQEDFDPEVLLK
jgi:hypothetical protein